MSLKIASKDCARILRILGDSTRLHVIEMLLKRPMFVGELNDVLHLEQSLLSHHLRIMRQAALVITKRDGKAVRYQLSPSLKSYVCGNTLALGCCRLTFEVE